MEAKIIGQNNVLKLQISKLEEQLVQVRDKEQLKYHYKTRGRRAVFEEPVKRRHKDQRTGIIDYMKKLSWKTYLTGSVVYSAAMPMA